MNALHIRSLFVCQLLFLAFLSGAQTPRIVHGLLISDENAKPVPLASIRNPFNGKKYLSNRMGYFHIPVSEKDTFRITSVGFDTLVVAGIDLLNQESDTIMLLMHYGTYQLKDVTIVYSNRKRDSIARVVAAYLKNDTLLNNNDRILKRPRGCIGSDAGMGFTGLITELYYEFSKAGKDMTRFTEFVNYYREVQLADTRYNKTVIRRATQLPDERLDEFILYCALNRRFIIESDDYNLFKAIKDCEVRFRKEKKLVKSAESSN